MYKRQFLVILFISLLFYFDFFTLFWLILYDFLQYDIGVQIQGNEFRIRVSDISTNRNKDIIFNCLKSAGLFEDFNKTTNKIIRNNPTSMKGNKDTNYKYCKFITDKYIAVY